MFSMTSEQWQNYCNKGEGGQGSQKREKRQKRDRDRRTKIHNQRESERKCKLMDKVIGFRSRHETHVVM